MPAKQKQLKKIVAAVTLFLPALRGSVHRLACNEKSTRTQRCKWIFEAYFVMVAVEVAPSHATVPLSVSATKRTGMKERSLTITAGESSFTA